MEQAAAQVAESHHVGSGECTACQVLLAELHLAADTWSEQLLKSLYYTTLALGQESAQRVERLWTTVASTKRNIIPILDFLITRGLEEIHSGVRFWMPPNGGPARAFAPCVVCCSSNMV